MQGGTISHANSYQLSLLQKSCKTKLGWNTCVGMRLYKHVYGVYVIHSPAAAPEGVWTDLSIWASLSVLRASWAWWRGSLLPAVARTVREARWHAPCEEGQQQTIRGAARLNMKWSSVLTSPILMSLSALVRVAGDNASILRMPCSNSLGLFYSRLVCFFQRFCGYRNRAGVRLTIKQVWHWH